MRFFSVEQLGPHQELTPEGFLICRDVAIARTGMQSYSTDELPMLDGIGGRITIYREEGDVFRPETLASFEGKPVTIDHPPVEVDPSNWRAYAVGTVQNVRRGSGVDADLIIADLLITDQSGIDTIRRDGVREVSCGYDAEYEQAGVGAGYQRNIVGNHVAIVRAGRAGPRCSIQDHETKMNAPVKKSFVDRLAAAFGFKDAAELESRFVDSAAETPGQAAQRATNDSIAALTATVDTLVATVAKLTADSEANGSSRGDDPKEDDDDQTPPADPTADTVGDPDPDDERKEPTSTAGQGDDGVTYTGDALTADVARAEILVPGFIAPTHDSALTAATFARAALAAALKTTDSAPIVAAVLAGRDVASLTNDAASIAFVAASELMRAKNNATVTAPPRASVGDAFAVRDRIAQMNAAAASHWKQ
jgi:hypothetical protein